MEVSAIAHPYHHALSSARRWGGVPEDYIDVHNFFDQSKSSLADFRHRSMLHHSAGIFLCEAHFGPTITISTGKKIPTRWIGEQHVQEDLGCIPSLADWAMKLTPEPWMNRSRRLSRELESERPRPTVPLFDSGDPNLSEKAEEMFGGGRKK